jgi:hypothetical protein
MSLKTVEDMIRHQSHDVVNEVMVYPSEGEAWKHFNSVHPYFLAELMNCVLDSVHMNSTHSSHLLLLILVGWLYLQFTTCPRDVYEAGVYVFIYGKSRS